MKPTDRYLEKLNEDFSFTKKVFKANVISKIVKDVKQSVKGKTVNKSALDKALKPIPKLSLERIDKLLGKFLPNFNHNKMLALKHFNKKYPTKKTNDGIASATAMIASGNDKYSVQDSIKQADRVYAYGGGGSGGGAFVLMLIGMFVATGAFSFESIDFKQKALMVALGALLIIVAFRSLY